MLLKAQEDDFIGTTTIETKDVDVKSTIEKYYDGVGTRNIGWGGPSSHWVVTRFQQIPSVGSSNNLSQMNKLTAG